MLLNSGEVEAAVQNTDLTGSHISARAPQTGTDDGLAVGIDGAVHDHETGTKSLGGQSHEISTEGHDLVTDRKGRVVETDGTPDRLKCCPSQLLVR